MGWPEYLAENGRNRRSLNHFGEQAKTRRDEEVAREQVDGDACHCRLLTEYCQALLGNEWLVPLDDQAALEHRSIKGQQLFIGDQGKAGLLGWNYDGSDDCALRFLSGCHGVAGLASST